MPKLRIKDLKPGNRDRKKVLWNKLMQLNLLVYNLHAPNDKFYVVVSSNEIIEKLLSESVKANLKKDHFDVPTPPEFQARRTIVLRNNDPLISDLEENELKVDLEERNEWLKVIDVIKIPNAPRILKIKVENAEMVRAAPRKVY